MKTKEEIENAIACLGRCIQIRKKNIEDNERLMNNDCAEKIKLESELAALTEKAERWKPEIRAAYYLCRYHEHLYGGFLS